MVDGKVMQYILFIFATNVWAELWYLTIHAGIDPEFFTANPIGDGSDLIPSVLEVCTCWIYAFTFFKFYC
jgi:hypothetical protein